jgi:hypothetical protein
VRDCDKNPIVIKNNYLFKKEFIAGEFMLPIIITLIYIIYTYMQKPDNNTLNLIYCKTGIVLGIIALLFIFRNFFKAVKNIKNVKLFIKIHDTYITYDYLTQKGEFKTFVLQKNGIETVKWGFFPYAGLDEKNEIWITETTRDRFGVYLFLPLNFVISCIYQILYFITNFKIEKYALIRFKGGIMAIPKNRYPSNENIKFEWRTLFNRHILQGDYYGK